MKLICHSLEELPGIAQQFLEATKGTTIYLFNAGMGVGKTTFIKELCLQLGVIDVVASPTFAIINEYKSTQKGILYHFDLYRLSSLHDAHNIGIEEYLYSGNICFIEWPEIIFSIIPSHAITVSIQEDTDGSRIIETRMFQ
jgi:tRNA threonylcarbamoyladenosine biosynthesis protein TsaE